MRPTSLNPLFRPLDSLKGAGKAVAPLVARLVGGEKVGDLLWHLPTGATDRRFAPPLAEAPDGAVVTLPLVVTAHQAPPPASTTPYRVVCRDARDGAGPVTLVWFRGQGDYLRRLLPPDATRVVSGKLERFDGQPQIVHPAHVVPPEEAEERIPALEPLYPLTAGVTQKRLAGLIAQALAALPDLPEWQDPALLAREGWPGWGEALRRLHAPTTPEDLAADSPARRRLAFDEVLAHQLSLLLVRAAARARPGRCLAATGLLRHKVLAALPFSLLPCQDTALAEIDGDMAADSRMLRLLQGDVGSGKTVVALLAMLNAVENGAQAALMAPTEILARQHRETLAALAAPADLSVVLLTGRDKGRARAEILEAIASGSAPLVVGTHALFQEEVVFHDLGLAVIDEQHRFGVHQRLALSAKGRAVDMLVMSATPIPRSLTLTHYGDMDVSRLTEKPPGRVAATTRALPLDRLDEVVAGLGRAIAQGAKVFWICPLVAENETSDLAAAEERHAALAGVFGARVGLVHGRMAGADKDRVMAAFAADPAEDPTALDILVATTVVEVGVHVPAARVMVIEHAERFGLAQLHQLRGRIGRAGASLGPEAPAPACLLLYAPPLAAVARARLETLRRTDDGFDIAEEDLRLRGAGDLMGTRQSGLPAFRLAEVAACADLVATARRDAERLLATDPTLRGPRGEALRCLLFLFERDQAVRTLDSG